MNELQDNKTNQNPIASKTMDILTHNTAPILKKKIDGLIEQLPLNGYKIKPSAIKAGYKESTAAGTALLKPRIEKRLKEYKELSLKELDPYFNVEDMKGEYDKICKQDKDIGSKLKAVTNILSRYDIIKVNQETAPISIPMLNIVVKELKPTEPTEALPIYEQPQGTDIAQDTDQNPVI